MTDLKFTVTYSRTVSDGNYGSEKFGLIHEFEVDSCSIDTAFRLVKSEVVDMILRGDTT